MWSTVVKAGVSKQPNTGTLRSKRAQRRQEGIVGTSTESSITAVTTKLVSVFATRFTPSLEADALSTYLSESLGTPVTCRKIDSPQSGYSSFHITAECKDIAVMFNPQLWPAGVYVRRYFEARRNRASDDGVAPRSGGGAYPHPLKNLTTHESPLGGQSMTSDQETQGTTTTGVGSTPQDPMPLS